MEEKPYIDPRWKLIDGIQDWFEGKSKFWLVISILTFSVLVLQVLLNFDSNVNPTVRQGLDFLLIPILALFVFSIFWRSGTQTFLSLVGALVTYGGVFFFLHTVNGSSQLINTFVASRLGYGIKHIAIITIIPNYNADGYFIVGILALAFCLAMAIIQFFQTKRVKRPSLSSTES